MIKHLRGQWVVHVDNRITRRKLFVTLYDPEGALRFRSRLTGEIIAYLDAEGVTEYILYSPELPNVLSRCTLVQQEEL